MLMSDRAKRMAKNHRRRKTASLNLVSLMDIFTILVFFLLVNSTEVAVLPNAKTMQVPESVSSLKPRETVVVMVTDSELLVQGERVAALADIAGSDSRTIPALMQALEQQSARRFLKDDDLKGAGEVTIMGDKVIPYRLLKKVMASCGAANFGKISLAVVQKDLRQEG